MALDPVPTDFGLPTAVYRDRIGGGLWEAIGYITRPATILRNVVTGETVTEVIGCLNAERWVREDGHV